MRIILISVGSDGDVLPILWLAEALRARGHSPMLIAACTFGEMARQAGVAFAPLSPPDVHRRRLRDSFLLASRYGVLFALRYGPRWNAEIYRHLERAGQDTVVVATAHGMLWADLRARHDLGLPVIRVTLEPPDLIPPPALASDSSPLQLLGALYGDRMREWLPAAAGGSVVRADHLRRQLPHVGLWPGWLLGQSESGVERNAVGFILPSAGPCERTFSNTGHVVFVAGTQGARQSWLHQFETVSAAVCDELSVEGCLLSRDLTASCQSVGRLHRRGFVDLSTALRRAQLIVHHGGIGTAARALACGVPQVIVPRIFSQPSNAERFRRLGVAAVVQPERYTTRSAPRAVGAVLAGASYRRRAAAFAGRMDSAGSISRACRQIEELANRSH